MLNIRQMLGLGGIANIRQWTTIGVVIHEVPWHDKKGSDNLVSKQIFGAGHENVQNKLI